MDNNSVPDQSGSPVNPNMPQVPAATSPTNGPGTPRPTNTSQEFKRRTHKSLFNKISREAAEYLMDNMSMLITSGVSIGEALESLAAELPDKKTRKTIHNMQVQIDEGVPFYKAMDATGLFTPSVVTLAEIGESSGRLPENLKVIATQMHKNNVMNSKIKAALLYPAFLLGLLFAIGTGIGVFLLPRLLTIIKSLQVEVGFITTLLIQVGTFCGRYGLAIVGLLVVLSIGITLAARVNERVRWALESILFHIPGVKRLLFQTEIARFGFVLGTLLDAGLPITTSLQSLSSSMSTHRYKQFTSNLHHKIEEGNSFSKALLDPGVHKFLPGTICQIIISAEKSGNLSVSLVNIGRNYEDKADITARNLETLLEPIILVILAIGVLFVALAVFLPIYSLIGNFNGTGG